MVKARTYREGEPCSYTCLHHVTKPCEGCGRIGGRGTVIIPSDEYLYLFMLHKLEEPDVRSLP